LGTWALTFNNNTNVTLTAPDGTTKSLTIPDADAANFQGNLIAYFGVRPANEKRIGTVGHLQPNQDRGCRRHD